MCSLWESRNMWNHVQHPCSRQQHSTQLSTDRWRDEENVYTLTTEYPTEGSADPCSHTGEPRTHYAKWNKPNTKEKFCMILNSLEYSNPETKSRMVLPGAEKKVKYKVVECLQSVGVARWKGSGCTTWGYLLPLNSTLSSGWDSPFYVLWISPQLKNFFPWMLTPRKQGHFTEFFTLLLSGRSTCTGTY